MRHEAAMDRQNGVRRRVVVCTECGQTFAAKRADAEMCSARCRTARHIRLHPPPPITAWDEDLAAVERVLVKALRD
jgi:hypothetical protein